jgi:hypothetical protein
MNCGAKSPTSGNEHLVLLTLAVTVARVTYRAQQAWSGTTPRIP